MLQFDGANNKAKLLNFKPDFRQPRRKKREYIFKPRISFCIGNGEKTKLCVALCVNVVQRKQHIYSQIFFSNRQTVNELMIRSIFKREMKTRYPKWNQWFKIWCVQCAQSENVACFRCVCVFIMCALHQSVKFSCRIKRQIKMFPPESIMYFRNLWIFFYIDSLSFWSASFRFISCSFHFFLISFFCIP